MILLLRRIGCVASEGVLLTRCCVFEDAVFGPLRVAELFEWCRRMADVVPAGGDGVKVSLVWRRCLQLRTYTRPSSVTILYERTFILR